MQRLLSTIGLGLIGAGLVAGQTPGDLDVSERLAVRETGVLLELPGLRDRQVEKLEPSDFVVTQSARLLRPTRIARLDPSTEPWQVLVYADTLLSKPRSIALAAQALAAAGQSLSEMGPVSVVASGAEDINFLDAERDPERIIDGLLQLGNARMGEDVLSRIRRTQTSRPIEDVFAEELSFLRERVDRLLVQATTTCELPPCLLFYLSDGFELAPSAAYRGVPLAELSRTAGGSSHSEISEELAKTLAAKGWTVVAMALEPTEDDPRDPKNARERPDIGTDFDAWKATTPGVQTGRPRSRGNRHDRVPTQALEVFTEPKLEPLRQLGAETAGAALRVQEQVSLELDRLRDRWWLFYIAEAVSPPAQEEGLAGAVEPLRVQWAEESSFQRRRAVRKRLGFVREEEELRAQRWARHPSPLALTEARLRSLRRGRHLVGNLELEALAGPPDVAGVQLSIPGTVGFEPLGRRTRVRLSAIGPAGSIRHLELDLPDAVNAPQAEVELPVWVRRAPSILEEIGTGRWAVIGR